MIVLLMYISLGLLDSIHVQKNVEIVSALDGLLSPISGQVETTYSSPFALFGFSKLAVKDENNLLVQIYPPLKHVDQSTAGQRDINSRVLKSIVVTVVSMLALLACGLLMKAYRSKQTLLRCWRNFISGKTEWAWRSAFVTVFILTFLVSFVALTINHYHILGTGKVGNDIFFEAVKSIRTGLVIGTVTTLVMLPFALLFGTAAGYFGGWIDDVVQYIYTTLSSIPGVLLIAASILSIQIFIANHSHWFTSMESRADARLLSLCIILGITSWTNLCRVLRAETLKLRELDYIQAAKALGSRWYTIILKHILPNLMHLILIALVLDFSLLVLAEAILTYIGIGADPTSYSWGNMINTARLELAREPVVWWPLIAAFFMMFFFVLSANLFADCVRDAFDPRKGHLS